MEKTKTAGLIFDSMIPYLDHLAPLLALFGYPLILNDPTLCELTKIYYPDVQTIEVDLFDIKQTLSNFSTIISCSPRALLQASFGPLQQQTLWLPHGNSDKGKIVPYFDALADDTTALIYGQKMADFFSPYLSKRSNLEIIRIGHYRLHYYQKHLRFYQNLLPFRFSKKQPTILYAPTWEDSENNCSFWQAFPVLAKNLPNHLNLIVKLHPNTISTHAPLIEQYIGKYETANLQFVLDFPPIIALLAQTDFYLGDRSSIGYDFLYFDKPMYFLNPHHHEKGRDLISCGKTVSPDNFYEVLLSDDSRDFSHQRKAMYRYTFDAISIKALQSRLQTRKKY